MTAPPMPFVPAEMHEELVIMAMLGYAGEVEEGERAIAPFRALVEPIADMVKPMPYPEMYPPEEGDYHPTAVARTMFIDTIDRDVSQTILEHLRASDAPMRVAQTGSLVGRWLAYLRRPPPSPTAPHESR